MGGADDEDDELYDEAVRIIATTRKASASNLQRQLRIGYNRAARLIDLMEERGLIGPDRGPRGREVFISIEETDAAEAEGG